jgi:hypothetical protein
LLPVLKSLVFNAGISKWRPCWLIGITAITESAEEERELRKPNPNILFPPKVDENWPLIGYDVADLLFMLSGLLGFVFNLNEIDKVRERWIPHLNEHNLFRDAEHALEFKKMMDSWAVEHAPFVVYGIYSIERHGSVDS